MGENQTDVDLLMLAITAKSGTQDAFAKMLGMTRQNLNRIIREAKKNGGKVNPKFLKRLREQYKVDTEVWRRNPTLDFHSATELESMEKIMMVAEPDEVYLTKKMFNHLMDENKELRKRLNDCEQSLSQKKDGRNSA